MLVYPQPINASEQPLGVLYIGALLRQHGHEVDLFYLTAEEDHYPHAWGKAISRWEERLSMFRPGVIGFSVIVTAFARSLALAQHAKERCSAPIVFGGANPTVEPERTIAEPAVDMVCVGEGEHAMLELVTALEQGEDTSGIANIWVKRDGEIIRNEVRPLVEDLDSLPYPDRSLIAEEMLNGRVRRASFITSRGCPYQCAYCHNPYLQELYRGKGRFVRFRSADSVIDEIKQVTSSYGVAGVTFSDDTFTLNRKRTLEFCQAYQQEVGLPFLCQTRANHADEPILVALKEAGCEEVHIGLESGNDRLRNEVLYRQMERDDIIRTFALARQLGIRASSFNMIGIPFETERTLWDTIDLNRQVRPDKLIHTIFAPLAGSRAKEICEENGWQMAEINASYYTHAFLKQPSISSRKLIGYQYVFDLYVYASKFLYPIIHLVRFLWEHVPGGRSLHHRLYRASVFQTTSLLRSVCLRGRN